MFRVETGKMHLTGLVDKNAVANVYANVPYPVRRAVGLAVAEKDQIAGTEVLIAFAHVYVLAGQALLRCVACQEKPLQSNILEDVPAQRYGTPINLYAVFMMLSSVGRVFLAQAEKSVTSLLGI